MNYRTLGVILGASLALTACGEGQPAPEAGEPVERATSALKSAVAYQGTIVFLDDGETTITAEGVAELRGQNIVFATEDPDGHFTGTMILVHNADLDLATGLGTGWGVFVEVDVAAGAFVGQYSGDLSEGGVVFEGDFRLDSADRPRNQHLRAHFSNADTGNQGVFSLWGKYTRPAR